MFFLLLVDCLNKNYALLKDKRTTDKTIQRYTSEYNSEFIMNILDFFERFYIPSALEKEDSPVRFFLMSSNIMMDKNYNIVLENLHMFLERSIGEEANM